MKLNESVWTLVGKYRYFPEKEFYQSSSQTTAADKVDWQDW